VWLEKYAFDPTSHEGTLDATVKKGTLGVISGKLSKQSPGAVQFRTPTSILVCAAPSLSSTSRTGSKPWP
jgi:hypothetical protein